MKSLILFYTVATLVALGVACHAEPLKPPVVNSTTLSKVERPSRAEGDRIQPNIIFILADDLGYADVGFNGQNKIKTPALNQMAQEGMVFAQHYAGSTVCMPSRCALLTGKNMGHATIRGNPRWTVSGVAVDLGPEDITVAKELKRVGYHTAIIGKWGLAEASDEGMPNKHGFDYFYGYRTHRGAHHYYWRDVWEQDKIVPLEGNDHLTKKGVYTHDVFCDRALEYISEHREHPFFLYLALTIPHFELTVPEEEKEPYEDLGWPKRPMKAGHYRHDEEGNVTYAAMVSRMDRDIGRILNHLKFLGIAENTLVIFSSDNGPEYEKKDRFFNSNGPLRGGKRDLYEGGIRVPFVAWWPGTIQSGKHVDHVSAFDDFLPTVCELADVQPQDETTGISYLPTLLGKQETQKKRDYLYWEFNEREGPIQAIRKGDWKAVKFLNKSLELYHLSSDLGESKNVAQNNPIIVRQMETLFKNARSESEHFTLVKRSVSKN